MQEQLRNLRQRMQLEMIYPRSLVQWEDVTYFLARDKVGDKVLCVEGNFEGFRGRVQDDVMVCPLLADNARELRSRLPWLNPSTLGLVTSAGCGDRLGIATPGHIRALRAVGGGITPVLAQQSMRENARTGRSPQQVIDDAMWGIFQEGWREPWGADADHLKTTQDINDCVAVGYTLFTIDPGAYVDNAAHTDAETTLRDKFEALPWGRLNDTPSDMRMRYVGRTWDVETFTFTLDEISLLRAACKYGAALAHVAEMYHHLATISGGRSFEVEISVDETETPTTALEHLFIANELARLGVKWVSLAPRYVGRFEKGVDYIGDLATFEAEFAKHAAIARVMGPYKLSIHSGSDKFSIYDIMARHTKGLVHLKTAGTSYLEALRTIARVAPGLFREILTLARARYAEDRATYHVSADVARVPESETLADAALPAILDDFDGREVLHVTFGSVLDAYGDQLLTALNAHEEAYYTALANHFIRHLRAFARERADG